MGLGLASCLIQSGHQVDIIAREDTVDVLNALGLRRSGLFGDFHATPDTFNCYASLNDLPENDFDYILVCAKSFDTSAAAKDLASCSFVKNSAGRVVHFQNGWGNAEKLAAFFPVERIYTARVITGFSRPRKNHVEITVHADAIHLGSLFGGDLSAMEPLARSIHSGGIPCEVTPEVEKDLVAKLLYNCALNALGAIFNVPYGILGDHAESRSIMQGIVEEVFQVMDAAGHATHWTTSGDYLEVFYDQQLPPTYKHESSMLQDLRARKKTEIDAINGAIVELGEKLNIPVPHNRMVRDMVKFLESVKPKIFSF